MMVKRTQWLQGMQYTQVYSSINLCLQRHKISYQPLSLLQMKTDIKSSWSTQNKRLQLCFAQGCQVPISKLTFFTWSILQTISEQNPTMFLLTWREDR